MRDPEELIGPRVISIPERWARFVAPQKCSAQSLRGLPHVLYYGHMHDSQWFLFSN
jgi:hypothetical protein